MNKDKLFCLGCMNLEPAQDFLESGNFFKGKLTLDSNDIARVRPEVIALCSRCSGPDSKSVANIMTNIAYVYFNWPEHVHRTAASALLTNKIAHNPLKAILDGSTEGCTASEIARLNRTWADIDQRKAADEERRGPDE